MDMPLNITYNLLKIQNPVICDNLDGFEGLYVKQNMLVTER
jgi:hypothetical protein